MGDVIVQLPDHVANQIAAGEVVQRPASVVKELLENAVDAGARKIEVLVVDAGRTRIQVTDDGSGMTASDARKCFDRHATSKLSTANDLFAIHTKGFRGEALASIASIARVELRTRQVAEDVASGVATELIVEGSQVKSEQPAAGPVGTRIAVKNLFYNVPARRNFLKSEAVELRHIIDEFQRIALPHPELHFVLSHNGSELFNLKPCTSRQRVVGVFGSKYDERLVPVEERTDLVQIDGFVGKPAFARRSRGEQFLFVNKRYIRHGMLHRGIMDAYDGLLAPGQFPLYVIFLEVDPARLDVNVHPTKVEVNFEDDKTIQAMLRPAVKRGLGRFNVAPSIDFDQEMAIDIPLLLANAAPLEVPQVNLDPTYNPFAPEQSRSAAAASSTASPTGASHPGYPAQPRLIDSVREPEALLVSEQHRPLFQWKQRYIVTAVSSGVIFIDQFRAHKRVLYDEWIGRWASGGVTTQPLLFPEEVVVNAADRELLLSRHDELTALGLQFEACEGGVCVNGLPAGGQATAEAVIQEMLADPLDEEGGISVAEQWAARMASALAIKPGKSLQRAEMTDLIDRLFACSTPGLDPFGQSVLATLAVSEIEDRLS